MVRVPRQEVPLLASWPLLYLTVRNPHLLTHLKNLQFADGQMQQVIVPTSFKHTQKRMVRTALAMVIVFLVSIVLLALYWPLSREAVLKELEDESQSRVNIGAFHGTYFPRPGCVLEHVTFQHNPKAGSPPLITVQRLRIEGSFSGLFRKRVRRVRAEGMRVQMPPQGSDAHFETPQRSPVVIDDLIADGAILEVASREPVKLTGQIRRVGGSSEGIANRSHGFAPSGTLDDGTKKVCSAHSKDVTAPNDDSPRPRGLRATLALVDRIVARHGGPKSSTASADSAGSASSRASPWSTPAGRPARCPPPRARPP